MCFFMTEVCLQIISVLQMTGDHFYSCWCSLKVSSLQLAKLWPFEILIPHKDLNLCILLTNFPIAQFKVIFYNALLKCKLLHLLINILTLSNALQLCQKLLMKKCVPVQ